MTIYMHQAGKNFIEIKTYIFINWVSDDDSFGFLRIYSFHFSI